MGRAQGPGRTGGQRRAELFTHQPEHTAGNFPENAFLTAKGAASCARGSELTPHVSDPDSPLFHTILEVLKVVPRPRPDVKGPSWVGHFPASGPRVASVGLRGRHLGGGRGGCVGAARCGLTLGPGCDPHP